MSGGLGCGLYTHTYKMGRTGRKRAFGGVFGGAGFCHQGVGWCVSGESIEIAGEYPGYGVSPAISMGVKVVSVFRVSILQHTTRLSVSNNLSTLGVNQIILTFRGKKTKSVSNGMCVLGEEVENG